jgi:integrase
MRRANWTSVPHRGKGVELMPVYKRKYESGTTLWYYKFQPPGAERGTLPIREFGFPTKREAEDAEAARRVEEQQKFELAKAGCGVAASPPKTLAMLLEEFREYAEKKLAPKTLERYVQQVAYLSPELLAMPLAEIGPLHLSREWNRLLECGGHMRKTKTPRPLSTKSVRHVAGVLSSAFGRAIKWGLVSTNPVTNSEPPRPKKAVKKLLTPAEQEMVFEAASAPWCLPMFLKMAASIAARRGELLALRWSDIKDGRITIARSLTQTKHVLDFKSTKADNPHVVAMPASILGPLEEHRAKQDGLRHQFGPDYRTDLDLIFANPDGSPLKPDSISSSVSLLFRKLKLPRGTSLHSLRHTHASELLDAGVPLPVVSARLGHSSIRTTADTYAHAIHGQDDAAVQRWEEYRQRNRPGAPTPGVQ